MGVKDLDLPLPKSKSRRTVMEMRPKLTLNRRAHLVQPDAGQRRALRDNGLMGALRASSNQAVVTVTADDLDRTYNAIDEAGDMFAGGR